MRAALTIFHDDAFFRKPLRQAAAAADKRQRAIARHDIFDDAPRLSPLKYKPQRLLYFST